MAHECCGATASLTASQHTGLLRGLLLPLGSQNLGKHRGWAECSVRAHSSPDCELKSCISCIFIVVLVLRLVNNDVCWV